MHRHLLDLSLAASIFFVTACDDSIRTNYATAAAAHAVGAIQRGWLPPSLPDSAFDIVESHVLDTNTGEAHSISPLTMLIHFAHSLSQSQQKRCRPR